MTNPVNAKTSTLLSMEPEQLLEYFKDEVYKRICETMYDAITKNMTMKRLMLDEVKLLGKTT